MNPEIDIRTEQNKFLFQLFALCNFASSMLLCCSEVFVFCSILKNKKKKKENYSG